MERYQDLTKVQLEAERARLDELYWNAMDYLGGIVAQRSFVLNALSNLTVVADVDKQG
jgi:hypothetical protein